MKSNIFKTLVAAAALALTFNACSEDKYTSRGDLFQPRFATSPEVTIKNNNDISIIWYNVNDAVGYTVQIFEDNYYQNLFLETDVTEPYITLEDLPYASRYYVRVRSNAVNPQNNSQWATCNFTTEARPDYAHILQGVSKTEIGDNQAIIRWVVDAENPADSFAVAPAMSETLPVITGYIPEANRQSGEMVITELAASTLYNVNIYDTSKKRTQDKPYNEVTFRTTGPAAKVIDVEITDNLSDMLALNNDDPDIPEGTEYELQAGTTYTLSTFAIKKGFTINGPSEGTRPVLVINGTWNIANGAYIAALTFQNVEIRNALQNQYFMNSGNPFTIENVSFTNCVFRNIYRGFWRHQASNVKRIDAIEIDNCWFDQCGWQGSTYGTFNFGSAGKGEIGAYDQIGAITIRNTTFSRGGYQVDPTFGWGNLINHSTTSTPINLTIENVTFYDFCVNNRLIDISNTERSTVTIRNVIVASPMGELIATGSGTRTTFDNNYTTTDYKLGGSKIRATDLTVSAADLFQDPVNGNYTIKDHSSLPYMTQAGDLRWIE